MKLKMKQIDVWAAEIQDEPGGLARTLRTVADCGADLDCVLARRTPEHDGKGVVFMTTLNDRRQLDGAGQAGLHRVTHLATLKIEGTDHPGIGADLTGIVADAGVSLHGITSTVIGRRFVCYASFDSVADMQKALGAIKAKYVDTHHRWREMLPHRTEKKIKMSA